MKLGQETVCLYLSCMAINRQRRVSVCCCEIGQIEKRRNLLHVRRRRKGEGNAIERYDRSTHEQRTRTHALNGFAQPSFSLWVPAPPRPWQQQPNRTPWIHAAAQSAPIRPESGLDRPNQIVPAAPGSFGRAAAPPNPRLQSRGLMGRPVPTDTAPDP